MIGTTVKTKSETKKVIKKAKRANIENLGHAGGVIRLTAVRSIRKRKGPAPPGQPPHTHTRRLPRAIKYAVEKKRQVIVIGPDVESFGTAGKAHEHGGRYRHERYPKRPFMGPALEKTKDRLPKFWAGSVR
ncbi:MAG: hypothetical protein AB7E55_32350 [Pigmentiphaga sp.]